jgi:hypothetical protein
LSKDSFVGWTYCEDKLLRILHILAVDCIPGKFKAAPSMALSESGGTIRRRTAYYQNLRIYECNNQTSVIRGTLGDMVQVERGGVF